MKKILVACCLAAVAAGATLAQEPAPQTPPAAAPAANAAPAADAAPSSEPKRTDPTAVAMSQIGSVFYKLMEPLQLTTEQRGKIDLFRDAFEKRTVGLRADLRGKIGTLRQARGTGYADPAVLEAKRAEVRALQEQLHAEVDKLDAEILTVLDEGQREQFKKIRAEMRGNTAGAASPSAAKSAVGPSTPPSGR
jgi:hypothetical protein